MDFVKYKPNFFSPDISKKLSQNKNFYKYTLKLIDDIFSLLKF